MQNSNNRLIAFFTQKRKSFIKWKRMPIHRKYSALLNPSSQGLFWFLTFFLAAYASIFSTEIKDVSWPASWESAKIMSINWHTVVFVTCATIAAFIVSITVLVKTKREDFLFAVVQTSPPAGFWKRHREATLRANEYGSNAELWVIQNEPAKYQQAIRVILDDLLNLMMEWDESNLARKVDYRSNIMKVIHFSEQTDFKFNPALDAELVERFLYNPVTEHYSGVIMLEDNIYSTTTKSKEPDSDPDIKPIVFPFTDINAEGPNSFRTNLRGAPYAVVSGSHCYVEDVEEIITHFIRNSEPRSERIVSNLEQYYLKKDYPAHSILSIPLFGTNLEGEKVVRHVLNLYRNQPGMLYRGEKAKEFFYVTTALTSQLELILAAIGDKNLGELTDQSIEAITKNAQIHDAAINPKTI
jgi:hypothetical protein